MNFFGDDRGAELRELFFESAAELLQAMNEGGLELEERPGDPETIRKVRRAVHTLKGDSASCGLPRAERARAFARRRDDAGNFRVQRSALPEVVLTAADTFDEMLAAYRGEHAVAGWQRASRTNRARAAEARRGEINGRPEITARRGVCLDRIRAVLVSEAMKRGESIFFVAAHVAPDVPCPLPQCN